MAGFPADNNKNFISAAKCIAFSATSLIGPSKCVKCVIDGDGQFELTSSVIKLLQFLKVDHPAISIIHDACKGFHKVYGTSSSTLVFMMGSWLQSFEVLADQGIPNPIVNHLLKEAVNVCIQEANNLSISVNEPTQYSSQHESVPEGNEKDIEMKVGQVSGQASRQLSGQLSGKPLRKILGQLSGQLSGQISEQATRQLSGPASGQVSNELSKIKTTDEKIRPVTSAGSASASFGSKPSPGNSSGIFPSSRKGAGSIGLKFSSKYSRHFTEAASIQKQLDALHALSKGIKKISCGVSRGNETIGKLLIHLLEIIKDSRKDVRTLNELKVPLDRTFVEFIDGKSESESTVLQGLCVTASHADIMGFSHLFTNQPLKVCLIDFDKMKYSKRMATTDTSVEDGVQKLISFQVSCVFYRGEHEHFREDCLSKGILALKFNSPRHLYSISTATGNPVASSLYEIEQKSIKTPVILTSIGNIGGPVGGGRESYKLKSVISVQFAAETEEKHFTVLLCGMTSTMTSLLEERLWSCLNRLNNILRNGKYMIGCGNIERKCMEKLLQCSGKSPQSSSVRSLPRWMQQELHLYRKLVYSEVAKGFERYCLKLSQRNDTSATKDLVIDDVLSKCEAWRRAIRLVDTISRIDVIITKQ